MNPETGKLEPLIETSEAEGLEVKIAQLEGQLLRPDGSPVPKHWAVFTVGELVTVKDQTFKVGYMNENTLVLEPVATGSLSAEDFRRHFDMVEP